MNIPPKCEDLHLKIAELERREAALREELEQCGSMAAMIENKEWAEHAGTGPVSSRVESALTQLHNELAEAHQRLTVAEQRAGELEELLRECQPALDDAGYSTWQIDAALKPAEEGEGSCIKCNGTGQADSGGVYPWGEGINIQCDCTPAEEIYQSGSEFKVRTGKSSRRPIGLKADQIVEVFGGGETQIARADKTDWRNVEMWRIKP